MWSKRKLSLMTKFECDAKLRPVRLSPHSLITLRAISGIKCANAADGLESSLLGGAGNDTADSCERRRPNKGSPQIIPRDETGCQGVMRANQMKDR